MYKTILWEQPRRCLSIEKAEREIGFIPKIRIEEGLRRTVDWFESKYEIWIY